MVPVRSLFKTSLISISREFLRWKYPWWSMNLCPATRGSPLKMSWAFAISTLTSSKEPLRMWKWRIWTRRGTLSMSLSRKTWHCGRQFYVFAVSSTSMGRQRMRSWKTSFCKVWHASLTSWGSLKTTTRAKKRSSFRLWSGTVMIHRLRSCGVWTTRFAISSRRLEKLSKAAT